MPSVVVGIATALPDLGKGNVARAEAKTHAGALLSLQLCPLYPTRNGLFCAFQLAGSLALRPPSLCRLSASMCRCLQSLLHHASRVSSAFQCCRSIQS